MQAEREAESEVLIGPSSQQALTSLAPEVTLPGEPCNSAASCWGNAWLGGLLSPLIAGVLCITWYAATSTSMRHQGLRVSLPDVMSLEQSFEDMPTFVTMETRGDPLLLEAGNYMNEHLPTKTGFAGKVVNVGKGKKWKGYISKVKLIADYIRTQDGEKLMGIVDGGDVFWGGCEPAFFLDAYRSIVNASGASIVFSAEVVCSEQECNRVPDIPDWALQLEEKTENLDLNGGFWKKYAAGCRGTWNDACSHEKNCNMQLHGESASPCSVPPAVKFLNSGVIIGPAKDLREMLDWAVDNYKKVTSYGDQSVFATYWLDNPDKVTLDYRGELSTSMSDLMMEFKVDKEKGVVHNVPFDRTQCLLHGNGRGQFYMMSIMRLLMNKVPQDLLDWLKD